jgi:hypothetical protein
MKQQLRKVILIGLTLVLAACILSPNQSPLTSDHAKWEEQNARHYRFDLSIGCFCPFFEEMPLSIEVRDGKAVSIKTNQGEDASPANMEIYVQYASVEKLFQTIERAQNGDADEILVEYDPTYGYPTQISIDYIKSALDDEMYFTVTNLEMLGKP